MTGSGGLIAPSVPDSFRGVGVAVLLPTLNEEGGLARTLDELPLDQIRLAGWNIRPIVIDGGSTDATVRVAEERGVLVLHQKSRGKGAATREALGWLRAQGVRFAIVLDADHTYPAEDIGIFLALLGTGTDLVIGVRYAERRLSLPIREVVHRAGNALLNYSASQLSAHPILDLCSGFWGVDLTLDLDRDLEAVGFEVEAELFLKAYRGGLRVVQVPIAYRLRIGEAKLRAVQDGLRIFLTILRFGRLPVPNAVLDGPRPLDVLLSDLLAICLVHEAEQIVLLADPTREATANQLVAALQGSGVRTQLILGTADPRSFDGVRTDRLLPGSVLIAFPASAAPPASHSSEAVLLLPRTERLIHIGRRRGAEDPRVPRESLTFQGTAYRLQFDGDQPRYLQSIRALGASVDRSLANKELALLVANGRGSTWSIWGRAKPRPGPRPTDEQ